VKGSITLESTPNIGSKAIFTVPLKVSSWCRNPRFDVSTSSLPAFRLSSMSSKTPPWTQPFAHRSISQDLLNQRISNSVMNYPLILSTPIGGSSHHGSIDSISNLSLTLSPEQRSKIHVLVVEDKYVRVPPL
jgi:hypothetical protein